MKLMAVILLVWICLIAFFIPRLTINYGPKTIISGITGFAVANADTNLAACFWNWFYGFGSGSNSMDLCCGNDLGDDNYYNLSAGSITQFSYSQPLTGYANSGLGFGDIKHGDLDGDGDSSDVVFGFANNSGVNVIALRNDLTTLWTYNFENDVLDIETADLDSDGTDEVVVTGGFTYSPYGGKISVLKYNGSSTPEVLWDNAADTFIVNVDTGDFDNGGKRNDIIFGKNELGGQFYVYNESGTMIWSNTTIMAVPPSGNTFYTRVKAVNLDSQDGDEVVATLTEYNLTGSANSTLNSIYAFKRLGSTNTAEMLWSDATGIVFSNIVTSDFDRNGASNDLLAAGEINFNKVESNSTIVAYNNNGEKLINYNVSYVPDVRTVAAADFDHDGFRDDVVVGSSRHLIDANSYNVYAYTRPDYNEYVFDDINSNNNTAFYNLSERDALPNLSDLTSLANSSDYTNMRYNDSTYFVNKTSGIEGQRNVQTFQFDILEPVSNITSMFFEWYGTGDSGALSRTHLNIYNYNSNSWTDLNSSYNPSALSYNLTSSISNYINSTGFITLLVYSPVSSGGQGLLTDSVKLTVYAGQSSKSKMLNPLWTFDVGSPVKAIEVGDFDNNGFYDDVAVLTVYGSGNYQGRAALVINNQGRGEWYTSLDSTFNETQALDLLDFDNDSYIDDVSVFGYLRTPLPLKANTYIFMRKGNSTGTFCCYGQVTSDIDKTDACEDLCKSTIGSWIKSNSTSTLIDDDQEADTTSCLGPNSGSGITYDIAQNYTATQAINVTSVNILFLGVGGYGAGDLFVNLCLDTNQNCFAGGTIPYRTVAATNGSWWYTVNLNASRVFNPGETFWVWMGAQDRTLGSIGTNCYNIVLDTDTANKLWVDAGTWVEATGLGLSSVALVRPLYIPSNAPCCGDDSIYDDFNNGTSYCCSASLMNSDSKWLYGSVTGLGAPCCNSASEDFYNGTLGSSSSKICCSGTIITNSSKWLTGTITGSNGPCCYVSTDIFYNGSFGINSTVCDRGTVKANSAIDTTKSTCEIAGTWMGTNYGCCGAKNITDIFGNNTACCCYGDVFTSADYCNLYEGRRIMNKTLKKGSSHLSSTYRVTSSNYYIALNYSASENANVTRFDIYMDSIPDDGANVSVWVTNVSPTLINPLNLGNPDGIGTNTSGTNWINVTLNANVSKGQFFIIANHTGTEPFSIVSNTANNEDAGFYYCDLDASYNCTVYNISDYYAKSGQYATPRAYTTITASSSIPADAQASCINGLIKALDNRQMNFSEPSFSNGIKNTTIKGVNLYFGSNALMTFEDTPIEIWNRGQKVGEAYTNSTGGISEVNLSTIMYNTENLEFRAFNNTFYKNVSYSIKASIHNVEGLVSEYKNIDINFDFDVEKNATIGTQTVDFIDDVYTTAEIYSGSSLYTSETYALNPKDLNNSLSYSFTVRTSNFAVGSYTLKIRVYISGSSDYIAEYQWPFTVQREFKSSVICSYDCATGGNCCTGLEDYGYCISCNGTLQASNCGTGYNSCEYLCGASLVCDEYNVLECPSKGYICGSKCQAIDRDLGFHYCEQGTKCSNASWALLSSLINQDLFSGQEQPYLPLETNQWVAKKLFFDEPVRIQEVKVHGIWASGVQNSYSLSAQVLDDLNNAPDFKSVVAESSIIKIETSEDTEWKNFTLTADLLSNKSYWLVFSYSQAYTGIIGAGWSNTLGSASVDRNQNGELQTSDLMFSILSSKGTCCGDDDYETYDFYDGQCVNGNYYKCGNIDGYCPTNCISDDYDCAEILAAKKYNCVVFDPRRVSIIENETTTINLQVVNYCGSDIDNVTLTGKELNITRFYAHIINSTDLSFDVNLTIGNYSFKMLLDYLQGVSRPELLIEVKKSRVLELQTFNVIDVAQTAVKDLQDKIGRILLPSEEWTSKTEQANELLLQAQKMAEVGNYTYAQLLAGQGNEILKSLEQQIENENVSRRYTIIILAVAIILLRVILFELKREEEYIQEKISPLAQVIQKVSKYLPKRKPKVKTIESESSLDCPDCHLPLRKVIYQGRVYYYCTSDRKYQYYEKDDKIKPFKKKEVQVFAKEEKIPLGLKVIEEFTEYKCPFCGTPLKLVEDKEGKQTYYCAYKHGGIYEVTETKELKFIKGKKETEKKEQAIRAEPVEIKCPDCGSYLKSVKQNGIDNLYCSSCKEYKYYRKSDGKLKLFKKTESKKEEEISDMKCPYCGSYLFEKENKLFCKKCDKFRYERKGNEWKYIKS